MHETNMKSCTCIYCAFILNWLLTVKNALLDHLPSTLNNQYQTSETEFERHLRRRHFFQFYPQQTFLIL